MNTGANAVLMAMLGGRGRGGAINGFLNSPNYDEERQKDALMNYGASLMGSQNQNNTTSGAVRQLGERLLGAVLTGYREKGYRDKEKTLGEQWGAITSRNDIPVGATLPVAKPKEGSTGDTAQDAASFEALAGGTAKGIDPDEWQKRFGGATMTPKWGATMSMKKPAGVLQGMRERALLYGDRLDPKIRERMNQFELMQSMMGEDPEKPVLKEIAGRLVNVFPDGTVRELADYSQQEAALRQAGRSVNQTNVHLPPQEGAFLKGLGELGAKKFGELGEAGAAAQEALSQYDALDELYKGGLKTGLGEETKAKAAKGLLALGIPESTLNGLGFQSVANVEGMQSLQAKAVMSTLMQQKGVQTEGDAERASKTWANLQNTPEGNKWVNQYARNIAKRKIEESRFKQSVLSRTKGDIYTAENLWNEEVQKMPSVVPPAPAQSSRRPISSF